MNRITRKLRGSKTQARSIGGNILVKLFLALLASFMVLPLIYAIVSSLKPFNEIFIFPPRFFVVNPTIDNFRDLFILASDSWVPFTRYLFNSFFVTIVATAFHVLLSSMAAYPIAKRDFPFKNAIFQVVILSLMFVSQVTFIPQYIIVANFNWIDTYLALILPPVGAALGLFLMKQFMEQIPTALLEAARIDGASEYRIVFKIVMPNVKPAWLTLIIFSFQSIWGNSATTFIYSEEMKMLPAAIMQIVSSSAIARMGVGMAGVVFLMIPPLLLFILLQSKVIETMAHAGIKD